MFFFCVNAALNCAPFIWWLMSVILGESILLFRTAGTVSKHAHRVTKMTYLHLRRSNFQAKRDTEMQFAVTCL